MQGIKEKEIINMTIRLTDEELAEMDGLIEFFEDSSDDVSCFFIIKNIVDHGTHIEDIENEHLCKLREQLIHAKDFFDSINVNTDLIRKLIYIFSFYNT